MAVAPIVLSVVMLLLRSDVSEHQLSLNDAVGGKELRVWVVAPLLREPRAPVVVFSHGAGGRPESFAALVWGLARAGYVVVSPYHEDCPAVPRALPATRGAVTLSLGGELAWRGRVRDLSIVIDGMTELEKGVGLHMDRQRVAVAGYGMGAATALIAGGARPVWRGQLQDLRDARVRSVVSLGLEADSMGLRSGSYPFVTVPLLVATTGARTAYEPGPARDAFLLTISGAPATSWPGGGSAEGPQEISLIVASAFLDGFLKGDLPRKDLMIAGSVVAPLRARVAIEGR